MSVNVLQILEEVAVVATDVELDATELASGVPVSVPFEPQVGTTNGQPIYLQMTLSTSKNNPANPSPVTASGNSELPTKTA